MFHPKLLCIAALAGALSLASCTPKKHSNQISDVDSQMFDTLTTAHSALFILRDQVKTQYPEYADDFNVASRAYRSAFQSYAIYRQIPALDQPVLVQIGKLTLGMANLEGDLQKAINASPAVVGLVRSRVMRRRQNLVRANITVSEVLADLEVAAQVAEAVPVAQPYATLAALIIQAAEQAVAQIEDSQGKPIDLSLITPVAEILTQ